MCKHWGWASYQRRNIAFPNLKNFVSSIFSIHLFHAVISANSVQKIILKKNGWSNFLTCLLDAYLRKLHMYGARGNDLECCFDNWQLHERDRAQIKVPFELAREKIQDLTEENLEVFNEEWLSPTDRQMKKHLLWQNIQPDKNNGVHV
jgi:hypothetical protein